MSDFFKTSDVGNGFFLEVQYELPKDEKILREEFARMKIAAKEFDWMAEEEDAWVKQKMETTSGSS